MLAFIFIFRDRCFSCVDHKRGISLNDGVIGYRREWPVMTERKVAKKYVSWSQMKNKPMRVRAAMNSGRLLGIAIGYLFVSFWWC